MKIFTVLALSFLTSAAIQGAQNPAKPPAISAATPAARSKIDPAKEADIRHLLDVAGTAAVIQQLTRSTEQSIKPMVTNALPPGEYRDKLVDLFFERFHSKLDTKNLLDLAVARYDENFSDEEIKGLIIFYQTPLGQKVVTTLPKLTAELQQDGQSLGQQAGRDAMLEVLSGHPDIAQALQAASHKSAPR